MQINYYEILGLPTTANMDEIMTAYRELAHICHPARSVYWARLIFHFLTCYSMKSVQHTEFFLIPWKK